MEHLPVLPVAVGASSGLSIVLLHLSLSLAMLGRLRHSVGLRLRYFPRTLGRSLNAIGLHPLAHVNPLCVGMVLVLMTPQRASSGSATVLVVLHSQNPVNLRQVLVVQCVRPPSLASLAFHLRNRLGNGAVRALRVQVDHRRAGRGTWRDSRPRLGGRGSSICALRSQMRKEEVPPHAKPTIIRRVQHFAISIAMNHQQRLKGLRIVRQRSATGPDQLPLHGLGNRSTGTRCQSVQCCGERLQQHWEGGGRRVGLVRRSQPPLFLHKPRFVLLDVVSMEPLDLGVLIMTCSMMSSDAVVVIRVF